MLEYRGRDVNAWRARLNRQLEEQRWRAERLVSYYDGEALPATIPSHSRDIFARLLRQAEANWAWLVVNAVAERLMVQGFRFGGTEADADAWEIWQGSQMDADAELAQTDALVMGQSFAWVGPDEDNPTGVSISLEHPTQATVMYAPGRRRGRVAGYKRFEDLDGERVEVLIFPDVTLTWHGADAHADPDVVELHGAGVVPMVEIRPSPRTLGPPRSELTPVLPIQDRINTTLYNRMVATDFGAFRQITATGIQLERDDDGGYRLPFDVGADRLLTSENPDARFGVIPESNLRGYLDAVEADVMHLAAITQTPPHYLLGRIVNASGDALKAAESGLVAKVRRRAAHIGEAWEEVMRLALHFVGEERPALEAETIWRDFETRSEGETVDALVKMATLGVPREVLWQRWGASPQEIDRWAQLAAAEEIAQARATATALGAADPYRALLAGAGEPLPIPAPEGAAGGG